MPTPEALLSGHSVTDADGIILASDSSICELLHRSPRELIGLSYLDITHGDDRAANARMIAALPMGGPAATIRKRYLRMDGTPIPVEVTVSRFTEGEREGRMIGTVRWHPSTTIAPVSDPLWQTARRIEALSTLRKRILGPELFPDHPLGILLQTYIAEIEGRSISPRELTRTLELSPTLVLRWIAALGAHGLVDAATDIDAPIQLTDTGLSRLEHLLRAAG